MALANYTDLKAAISDWLDRSDITASAADFVRLAEARINRLLEGDETDATVTGSIGSRVISVSSLSVAEPIAVFIVSDDGDETEIVQKTAGTFPYSGTNGVPAFWALDGSSIKFDCPLDAAYTFRFRYRGKYALSDASPTNALLTNAPDVYLAAAIWWGCVYVGDGGKAVAYKHLWDEFEDEHSYAESRKKRAILTPDPALAQMGGSAVYSTSGE